MLRSTALSRVWSAIRWRCCAGRWAQECWQQGAWPRPERWRWTSSFRGGRRPCNNWRRRADSNSGPTPRQLLRSCQRTRGWAYGWSWWGRRCWSGPRSWGWHSGRASCGQCPLWVRRRFRWRSRYYLHPRPCGFRGWRIYSNLQRWHRVRARLWLPLRGCCQRDWWNYYCQAWAARSVALW